MEETESVEVSGLLEETNSINSSKPVYRINPSSIEDGRTIVEKLINKITVEINLKGLDLTNAQRIIDFVSGAVYPIDAKLECVAPPFEFVATPNFEEDIENVQADEKSKAL